MNLAPGSQRAFMDEMYGKDKTWFCDNCDHECAEGHNIPDRAFFCCICHDKPYSAFWHRPASVEEFCPLCQGRLNGDAA